MHDTRQSSVKSSEPQSFFKQCSLLAYFMSRSTLALILAAFLVVTVAALEVPRHNLVRDGTQPTRPGYVSPTTLDTIAVSQINGIHEAVLECSRKVEKVNHIVICDIFTFDDCGHARGDSIVNASLWEASAYMTSAPYEVNYLVSPIAFVRTGQFRFYFTPTIAGQYEAKVVVKDHDLLGPGGKREVRDTVVVVQESKMCAQLKGMVPQSLNTLNAFNQKMKETGRAPQARVARKRDAASTSTVEDLINSEALCDDVVWSRSRLHRRHEE